MSLLMKALEKAAKDRLDARAEPVAAGAAAPAPPAPAAKELTLEPLAADAPAASRAEPAPRPAPVPAPAREQVQAQATTVLQAAAASRPARRGVADYVRAHPLPVLGSIAGLFALGFGVYVYLQIAHPSLFIERLPPAPAKGLVAPLVPAPAPTAGPLPTGPLLQEAAAESAAAAAAARREKPQPATTAAAEEPAARNTVVVSPGSAEPVLNPLLPQAYTALQSGQLEPAQRLYNDVLGADPKNIDALLGLAAVAVRRGDSDEAVRRYLHLLELEPQNALAQSGLIALLGRADPVAAESKLRQLIAREPSAHLYFTLGNLYADQSQWAAAQHAYFQAHYLEPANPDYAYNLAVGLEHVSQPKLALGYYQRAMQLAAVRGRANFNLAQAQERIGKLVAQVQ